MSATEAYAREALRAAADHIDVREWPNHQEAFHAAMRYNMENLAGTGRDFESVQQIIDNVTTDVFIESDIPMSARSNVLRNRADHLTK